MAGETVNAQKTLSTVEPTNGYFYPVTIPDHGKKNDSNPKSHHSKLSKRIYFFQELMEHESAIDCPCLAHFKKI